MTTPFSQILSQAPKFTISYFDAQRGFTLHAERDNDSLAVDVAFPGLCVTAARLYRPYVYDCILTAEDMVQLRPFIHGACAYMEAFSKPYATCIRAPRARLTPPAQSSAPAHRYDWSGIAAVFTAAVSAGRFDDRAGYARMLTQVTDDGPSVRLELPVTIGTRVMHCTVEAHIRLDTAAHRFVVTCESMSYTLAAAAAPALALWKELVRYYRKRTVAGVLLKNVVLSLPLFDLEVRHRVGKPQSSSLRYKAVDVPSPLPAGWAALAAMLLEA